MKALTSSSVLMLLLIMLSGSSALSKDNSPMTRNEALINAFQIMCHLEPLRFDRLSERATLMRMVLQDDDETPSAQNTVTRSKSWVGALTTGPFLFLLQEMRGEKGVSTSCAIVGDVLDTDVFRTEAVKDLHLKTLPSTEMGSDGSRSYTWDKPYGDGSTLIIRDFKPVGRAGVMIKLLEMRKQS